MTKKTKTDSPTKLDKVSNNVTIEEVNSLRKEKKEKERNKANKERNKRQTRKDRVAMMSEDKKVSASQDINLDQMNEPSPKVDVNATESKLDDINITSPVDELSSSRKDRVAQMSKSRKVSTPQDINLDQMNEPSPKVDVNAAESKLDDISIESPITSDNLSKNITIDDVNSLRKEKKEKQRNKVNKQRNRRQTRKDRVAQMSKSGKVSASQDIKLDRMNEPSPKVDVNAAESNFDDISIESPSDELSSSKKVRVAKMSEGGKDTPTAKDEGPSRRERVAKMSEGETDTPTAQDDGPSRRERVAKMSEGEKDTPTAKDDGPSKREQVAKMSEGVEVVSPQDIKLDQMNESTPKVEVSSTKSKLDDISIDSKDMPNEKELSSKNKVDIEAILEEVPNMAVRHSMPVSLSKISLKPFKVSNNNPPPVPSLSEDGPSSKFKIPVLREVDPVIEDKIKKFDEYFDDKIKKDEPKVYRGLYSNYNVESALKTSLSSKKQLRYETYEPGSMGIKQTSSSGQSFYVTPGAVFAPAKSLRMCTGESSKVVNERKIATALDMVQQQMLNGNKDLKVDGPPIMQLAAEAFVKKLNKEQNLDIKITTTLDKMDKRYYKNNRELIKSSLDKVEMNNIVKGTNPALDKAVQRNIDLAVEASKQIKRERPKPMVNTM